MLVGVLALQGAFYEHEKALEKLQIPYFEIRQKKDAEKDFDGLIIPGGESTVIGKLLKDLDLFDILKQKIENGLCVFGTCAGLILLAKEILNDTRIHLATMDIKVKRNAYGRQISSFETIGEFKGIGKIPMIFIRAPYIEEVYNDCEVLAKVNNNIVAARNKNQLVTSFHPELSESLLVHKYFIDMILKQNK